MPKKLTTKEFIRRARKVHGNLYDYSKVVYKRMNEKVLIIDPDFGEFWQQPNNHLQGKGSMARKGTPKKTTKQFIKEAKEVHGETYNYSKVVYKGTDEKVLIIDPQYGEFWQTAKFHLSGGNHSLRANKIVSKKFTLTTEEFIKRAREVHGDLYDYSKVVYKGNKFDVCIIDPEHGEFWQAPGNHLSGKGCPSRSHGGFDPNKPGILYYIRIMDGMAYKIGITNKSVSKRFMGDMKIIDIIKTWYYPNGHDAQKEERRILHEFRHSKYYGDDLLMYARNDEMFRYDVLGLDDGKKRLKNYVERDNRKSNNDDFISKAREVNGDKYDYSKVDYINNRTKVIIIDPEYGGEFLQAPVKHLAGQGNPKRNGRSLNTEDFIKKAREVHGDLYDYNKAIYVDAKTEVIIIDPDYGEFLQTPFRHLRGSGHKKRNPNRKSNTEEFIQKAKDKHGDKYDYSKVDYIRSDIKVIIIDKEYNNEFEITPRNHLMGRGNPLRANNKRKTTEQFIKEAREIHGNLYDYSKAKYINAKTKLIIIDPVYGEFETTPNTHISNKGGHPQRAIDKSKKNLTYTKEQFIKKAKLVHGDKYDYTKVEYINSNIDVCIIDPDYGEFYQNPSKHLAGANHPKRAIDINKTKARLTPEEFIRRAREVHGDLYDYSKVEYKGLSTKVLIIDPDFGEFWQQPNNHLQGKGNIKRGRLKTSQAKKKLSNNTKQLTLF